MWLSGMRERVYTVNDYYDGPRNGVADFRGQPHIYLCMWDKANDDWAEEFLLEPIDAEFLEQVLNDWGIWRKWEASYHRGEVTADSHPGESEQIAKILDISKSASAKSRAKFHPLNSPNKGMKDMEVEWIAT